MKRIPARPDLGHLKKQAKELLAFYRANDPTATIRFRDALPAAAGKSDAAIASLGLRLHDAQSCIAREYGFASWADLQGFVLARRAQADDPANTVLHWLRCVYAGDIAGGTDRSRPSVAVRLLEESPGLLGADPYLACAVGDEATLRQATAQDPGWIRRPGGPLELPPLVAVTHSGLLKLPAYREGLLACARFLLQAGADANQSVGNRWPPASLEAPDEDERLSALYGAAGQNHDAELTRLLLKAGARVTGSNALYRVLDLDALEALRLLLAHGGDANEPARSSPTSEWGTPLLWAIRRRRSPAHIETLLAAGANPSATTPDGTSSCTLALRFGLTEVAQLLQHAGGGSMLSETEAFVAACARVDEASARRMLGKNPKLIGMLSETQLRLLPELAAEGCDDAVKLMVELGWPVAVRAGDWNASALNHAVFRGDAALARFMLEHGASWQERHGFDDNACGSLSWASVNEPVENGDWLRCAEALVAHGSIGTLEDHLALLIGQQRYGFSEEVTDYLLGAPQG